MNELSEGNYQIVALAESYLKRNLFSDNLEKNPIKLFKYFAVPQNEHSILTTDDGHSIYSRYFEGAGIVDIFSISPSYPETVTLGKNSLTASRFSSLEARMLALSALSLELFR